MTHSASKRRKPIAIALGWLFLAAAVAGAFLPVIPQIPFAIVAAFFFSKGSPRLHHWILNQKHFGAAVRDWEMGQVVRVRLKLLSIATMVGGAAIAYARYREANPAFALGIPGLFALACGFVATRPSRTVSEGAPRSVGRISRF